MKSKRFKAALSSILALSILLPSTMSVHAATTHPTDQLKDHWNFDSLISDQGDCTEATLEGRGVSLVDSGNPVFGNVLRFGEGTDNFLKLKDYINTGSGAVSFSMWYCYDTSISGDMAQASAVMLQHEGAGRSLLTLRSDGKYHTFINGTDVISENAADKGTWQHITVTFDQDAKEVKYYINGVLDSKKPLGDQPVNEKLTLRLGSHKTAGNTNPHSMRGDVDEFYVYKKVLSDAEAKAVYEDKAAQLYQLNLQTLVNDAQALYDTHSFADDHACAIQLADAIKAAREASSLDEMKLAYAALENAVKLYRSAIPLNLTVNLDQVNRVIDADSIFGINHRYAFNGYGTFDPETMKMKDEFTQLYKQAGFGSIRYPGGTISNLFNWKTTLGPKDARKKQIHGFYNNPNQGGIAPNFGIAEIADFATDVQSEIVYVYSLGRGSAQDAADLVEFLNAKVGTNPNGGIDWAQVRANNGHPEPYNVRYFEIGNEMQQAYGKDADGTSSQGYWTEYVDGGAEKAYTEGGTAKFIKRYTVDEENWNKTASQSDGSANLVRYLRYANVNPGTLDENGNIVADSTFQAINDGVEVYVGTDGHLTKWTVVDSLETSSPDDTHCVVNYADGSIQFGDGEHGKIPAEGQNIYATYSVKRDGFIDISKAIKTTTDQINQAEGTNRKANVYTSFESRDFINHMTALGANDWYDGMTIHPYSGTVSGNNANAFYDNAMKLAEDVGIHRVQEYVDMLPDGKVPVISEFGIFKNTEAQLRSQTNALYTAKVMMEYVKLGSPYIQKHCLSDWYIANGDSLGPTQQAAIQVVPQEGASTKTGEGNFKFFSTPSAHVFQMLNAGFGDKVVNAELESAPVLDNGVTAMTTLASKDDQGNMYIALVNVDRENDYNVRLNVPGFDFTGRTVNVQTLTAQNITDENSLDNPNNVTVHTNQIVADETFVVDIPQHSFVVLKVNNTKESVTVDKTMLEQAIAKAEAMISNQSKYVQNKWQQLVDALDTAKIVMKNENASEQDVQSATDALLNAIQAQKLKADKSVLDEVITQAKNMDLNGYTAQSVSAFRSALQNAQTVQADESLSEHDQNVVDEAVNRLRAAIQGLTTESAPQPSEKPEPSSKPEPSNKPETSNTPTPTNNPQSPKTGDSNNIILLSVMMLSSAACAGALLLADYKRRHN